MKRKHTWIRLISILLVCVQALLLFACAPAAPTDGTTTEEEVTTPLPATTPSPTTPQTPTTPTVTMLPSQEVKVVGINLLVNRDSVDQRAPLMLSLLTPIGADSIGVQECAGKWEDYLREGLGDKYGRVGLDCNGKENATSFATYIYYRRDKYVALDSGTFWMSKTPDTPSKYGDTVDMNRTCTWVLLENIETGFRYVHMNCHLDWMDLSVNEIQCTMIRNQIQRFEAMGYPVFATGDYNSGEMNASYTVMNEFDSIADARYIAKKTTDVVTHVGGNHDYTLDYCYVTKNKMTVNTFDVIDTRKTSPAASDHRGVYVHATVKSLPKQEYFASHAAFADNAEIKLESGEDTVLNISFPQARDKWGNVARSYRVTVTDQGGKTVIDKTVESGYYLPAHPERVTCYLSVPKSDYEYCVRVVPVSLLGDIDEPLMQWFRCTAKVITPVAVGAADLFSLGFEGNTPVDRSSHVQAIETVGTVTVQDNSLLCTANGNLKIASFKDRYNSLLDGFSAVTSFRTGDTLPEKNKIMAIFGNLHSGGFGIQVKNGKILMMVHLNGSYRTVEFEAKTNTEYHVVAVYDPTLGLLAYVNGSLAGVVALEAPVFGLPTDDGAKYLCVGADSDASGQGEFSFLGTVYEAGVYDAVLTAENALYLYQNSVS